MNSIRTIGLAILKSDKNSDNFSGYFCWWDQATAKNKRLMGLFTGVIKKENKMKLAFLVIFL
jgi:hypothetical protein